MDPRSIYFSNLILLGFQPGEHVQSTGSGTLLLDKFMFARGKGNAKAFEIVAWFLFHCMNPEECNEVKYYYHYCYY